MVAIVIVTVMGLFAFLRYSRVGLRIRAGTFDLETVATLGVNVRHLRTLNFAVGCLLEAAFWPPGQIGLNPRPRGLIGEEGMLIGMAAALTTVFYPAASEAVIYAIMMS